MGVLIKANEFVFNEDEKKRKRGLLKVYFHFDD
jgi:hypothetical protein